MTQIPVCVFASGMLLSNLEHDAGLQFGVSVPFAAGPSSLGHLVGNVVCIRSKKEMVRIYAGRIVAAMENLQALGDRAVLSLVGNPMG